MDTFGIEYSTILSNEISKVNCIRRVGNQFDFKLSTITTFGRLEFLTDNDIVIISEDVGSPGKCLPYKISSLIISGNEAWTIYGTDGTSNCFIAANSTSFVPGLVKDTRDIGFEHNSICAFKKGCHTIAVHYIKNSETEGVLKRSE